MPLFTFFIPIASVLGSIFFIIYINILFVVVVV